MAGMKVEGKDLLAKKTFFELPKGQVFVKFIRRPKGNIRDERHVAFGGLLEGSWINIVPRKLENGAYINVLTNEEKDFLEEFMKLPKNALSIYAKQDNYWDKLSFRLTKEGTYFNLEDPEDYIKVKILETYNDLVASSVQEYELKRKATYKFIIVRPDEEINKAGQKVDLKQEAWMAFGKIVDSVEGMTDLLSMYAIKPAAESSLAWLKTKVSEQIERDPQKFISILNDPDYKVKIMLKKAVANKVVIMNGGLYQTKEGVSLAPNGLPANFNNAVAFLKSSEGQDMRLLIESQIA